MASTPLPSYDDIIEPDGSALVGASIRPDGLVEIDCPPTLSRRLSQIAHIRDDLPPPVYSPRPSGPTRVDVLTPPRLNIVIQLAGSRGDVQPFVALGCALRQQYGHRVRIATHAALRDMVHDAGLEFYPLGGDPTELMAYMVRNPGLVPSMASLRAGDVGAKRKMLAEMLDGCWKACIEPDPRTGRPFVADAIIANPPCFGHVHCAQALGIPLHIMFTMPWTSTRAFAHPLANLKQPPDTNRKTINLMSYKIIEWMTWQGLGDLVNEWRVKTLGLEAIPEFEGPRLLETLQVPHTYCWSPTLVPRPSDWPQHIDVCGFVFREPAAYEPPEDLRAFLSADAIPIYIGFGSIVVDDPIALTDIVLAAVQASGVRALISRGWSNLGQGRQSDQNIFYLDDCPHEWLFPRVAAAVHHGGAGTTACGLINGVPTMVVPFFGDQPFWGAMVASAGAGPPPIPYRSLSADNLAKCIIHCQRPDTKTAAERVAEKMRTESGVQAAINSFHANLPTNLHCDVLSREPAAWLYEASGTKLKLSKKAASILSEKSIIKSEKLKHLESRPLFILPKRIDPITAVLSASLHTVGSMGHIALQAFIRPYQGLPKEEQNIAPTLGAAAQVTSPAFSESSHSSSSSSLSDSLEPSPAKKLSTTKQESIGQSLRADTADGREIANPPSERRRRTMAAGRMMLVSAKFTGRLILSPAKGLIVDIPLAAIEGMRAMPRHCGVDGYERQEVVDWKSGATVGVKSFAHGMHEGLTDIFFMTYAGKRDDGALGVAKGLGQGLVSMGMKTGAGGLGLFIYPFLGAYKSIHAAIHAETRRTVDKAKRDEGFWMLQLEDSRACSDFDIARKVLNLVQDGNHRSKRRIWPL